VIIGLERVIYGFNKKGSASVMDLQRSDWCLWRVSKWTEIWLATSRDPEKSQN